jgi:hypothetical protein
VRRTLAALFLVLACVLPAVALSTWWAYAEATDTAKFTKTAQPLASDAAVQAQVVDELVRVAGARLAGVPDQAAARREIRAVAETLVQTSTYRKSWLAVQRSAHARLAARLSGDVKAPLTLDLAPIADALRRRVARSASLAPVADAIVDPQPVVLLDRQQVQRARDAAGTVRIVRGIAIPAAIIALLGVVLTAPRLAGGLVRAGLCVGVSTLLVVIGDALARGAVSSAGQTGKLRLAVYDVLTDPLRGWVIGGVIAAVVLVAVGAALSALARPAGAARPA